MTVAQIWIKYISKEYIEIAMDNPLFGLFLALFAGVWLCFVFRDVARIFERGHRGNWFVVLMGVLVFVGERLFWSWNSGCWASEAAEFL